MVRALDTSSIALPGVSTPRLLARLCGMFALSFAGATIAGLTALLVGYPESRASFRDPSLKWYEAVGGVLAAFGPFLAPFVVFGAIWAWGWAVSTLWDKRWVVGGLLVTLVTSAAVSLAPIASHWIAASIGMLSVPAACLLLARWSALTRR
jgi:hypothetical protein